MPAEALAHYLATYQRHARGHTETAAERSARYTAEAALQPFEQKLARVLYVLDNQVAVDANPDARVTFFASALQDIANQIHEALQMEAAARQAPAEVAHQEL